MVRVRPFQDHENESCLRIHSDSKSISILKKNDKHSVYTFDHVASQQSTQKEMMKCVGQPITDKVLEGYNGTIFAYGQTGSGKTYTMSGEQTHHFGLMPNIFRYLFKQIEKRQSSDSEYSVKATCCEIYNDHICDLLDSKHHALSLREDVRGKRFFVQGLSEKKCASAQQMFNYVGIARWFRQTKATKMNSTSSRSHLIFTVIVTKRTDDTECNDPSKKVQSTISRLNLVDLAGSERQRRTQATGKRFKEAKAINTSLTELGRVISSLVAKQKHIPYNNSKLTKLLKDSLGGSSCCYMIANVSPSRDDMGETLGTLQFADRAKQIKNTAKRNHGVHLSLKALKEQNSKFVQIVESLTAKYEAAQKKYKIQRRKSVELSGKLDVVSKKNTDLMETVNNMKSQRELALERSAKALMEQDAQIEALQRQINAQKKMKRSITEDNDLENRNRRSRTERFPFNSPDGGLKQNKRSISSPDWGQSGSKRLSQSLNLGQGQPLGNITTKRKSIENSFSNIECGPVHSNHDHDQCRKSEMVHDDCDSTEVLTSSVLDVKIAKAEQDLNAMRVTPMMELSNVSMNKSLLSGLGSESESFM